MNETIILLFGARITGWKLIGYLGILMFSSRWFVQLYYSRKKGRSVMPTLFWLMSIAGSLLCLIYFTFGKNDSVGIISYFFPLWVAGYNLYLNRRHARKKKPLENRNRYPSVDIPVTDHGAGKKLRSAGRTL
jgi:lipid-A-disaccharide synthase-like uncharacterized protein